MYSSIDGSTVRQRVFSRKFCGFLLVLIVLLFISLGVMFSGGGSSNGKELVDGEYVDEVGAELKQGEEAATPAPHYESKRSREIRLRREREERKQAYLKEKEEKRLRKEEEEERVKREQQETERLHREEEAAAAAAEEEQSGDDYDEQVNDEDVEVTENNNGTVVTETFPPLSDDYYHLDDELEPDCEDNSKLGVIGGELVQVIEIPHNRNFRSSLEQWTKEDKMVRLLASKGEALKCPRNLPTASIVVGARGYGFCRTLNRTTLRSVVVLRNPVHRMYSALQAKADTNNSSVDDMVRTMNATKQFPADYLKFIQRFGTEQTRYLCGVECLTVNKDLYTEEEMLARAMENLARVDVIGFADQMDKMIPQLKYLLPAVVPKQFSAFPPGAAGEWDTPIPSDVRDILRAWSQMDNKVFLAGQDRFVEFNSEAKACVEGD